MSTRFVQFTTKMTGRVIKREVHQYSPEEMAEVFNSTELLWLSQGKVVEWEDDASKTQIVDLQYFFDFNFKQ